MVEVKYVGRFDDFGQRNGLSNISLDGFNRYLVQAAVVGQPLLINDGYILNHPVVRTALITPTASPLRSFVRAGLVKILMRTSGNLALAVERMADEGSKSFQNLATDKKIKTNIEEIKRWTDEMAALDEYELSKCRFVDWPEFQIDAAYYKMMRSLEDHYLGSSTIATKENKIRVFGELNSQMEAGTRSPRDRFEKIVARLANQDKISYDAQKELLTIANQAYHYNWSACLNGSKQQFSVVVETEDSERFSHILPEQLTVDLSDKDYAESKVTLEVPVFCGTDVLIKEDWDKLAIALGDTGSELWYAKQEFLLRQSEFVRCIGNTMNLQEAQQKAQKGADNYSKLLIEHLCQSQDRTGVTFIVGLANIAIGLIVSTFSPLLGVVHSITGLAASEHYQPALVRKMNVKNVKLFTQVKALSGRKFSSAIEFDSSKVTNFLFDIPIFKG